MKDSAAVTRFAPSPTGLLHAGNARTALFNYLYASRCGGRFLLRIEDSDAARSRDEYVDALIGDLRWLGLHWQPAGDDEPAYRQSRRGEIYASFFETLQAGGQAYPCFCTVEELKAVRAAQVAAGRAPRYPGTCRELSAAERRERRHLAASLRLRVPQGRQVEFDDLVRGPQSTATATIGDFVVRRADGTPAFFFCNAVDDALMGVSHVLRGEDHLSNTPRQLLVLAALGLDAPRYGHLPLLLTTAGAVLSKRDGAGGVAELRGRGYLPEALVNYLARLGHHYSSDGWLEPEALATGFSLDQIGRAPAHFDETQLDHWQKLGVARLPSAKIETWLADLLPDDLPMPARGSFVELIRHNVTFPAQARAWVSIVFDAAAVDVRCDESAPADFFAAALRAYEQHGPVLRAIAKALGTEFGLKGRALYGPLRYALTGREDGPELATLLELMPAEVVRERLVRAAEARC